MLKVLHAIALAGLATGALPATAMAQQDAAPQEAAKTAEHYSVETTTIGTMLDDPEAAAILERIIPTVYANDMFRTMGRPNTLQTAAQYESDLTEAKMAEIQAAFDELAAKR